MINGNKVHKREMIQLGESLKRGFLGLILSILSVLLYVRCVSDSSLVVVDNPSDRAITFVVDATTYTLEPKSNMEISLPQGEHTLTNPEGKHITFTRQEYEEKSLLNPLEATYVIVTTAYTDSEKEHNIFLEQMYRLIELNGRYYYGPLQVINAPYMARTASGDPWFYGLDEEFEDRISVNAGSSTSINIKKAKIYRVEDFERAYADLEVDPSELNEQ